MDLRETPEQASFRQSIRSWLEANLPTDRGTPEQRMPRSAPEHVAFARAWQAKLFEGGWAGLHWPRAYGGRDVTLIEDLIYGEEYARAWAPDVMTLSVGTTLVGPTLIRHGTEAQQQRFLQPILEGKEIWCQGFSEPNAGSDLASLQTRGEVGDREIVVTGQKIWTSFALYAEWCLLMVRTDPEVPKHKGITMLLVDMASPGIEVRPLRDLTGAAHFNEVFFDRVRVPLENIVGGLSQGWDVAMTTLGNERNSSHGRLRAELLRLIELARATTLRGRAAVLDTQIRQQLAQYAIEIEAMRHTAYRQAETAMRTGQPGPGGSIQKVLWSETEQRMMDTAVEILGPAGTLAEQAPQAAEAGYWARELLWTRCVTLYGGTSEIQRKILSERVLGLPRAPS